MNQPDRRKFLTVVGAGIVAAPLIAPKIARAEWLGLGKSESDKFKGSLLGTEWEGIETTKPVVQQAYFPEEHWEKSSPAYMEYNLVRDDNNAKRGEANLIKHEANVLVAGNRAELNVHFKNKQPHPQAAGHWWSWVEIWDNASDPSWIFIHEPAEGETRWGEAGLDFSPDLFLAKPIKGNRIRVRAYCVTHGLYTKYFDL